MNELHQRSQANKVPRFTVMVTNQELTQAPHEGLNHLADVDSLLLRGSKSFLVLDLSIGKRAIIQFTSYFSSISLEGGRGKLPLLWSPLQSSNLSACQLNAGDVASQYSIWW